MATITIEDVPETYIKKIWKRVKFDDIKISKKKLVKNDPTIRLQKLINAPNNTSYGPMSVEEFISEMKKW